MLHFNKDFNYFIVILGAMQYQGMVTLSSSLEYEQGSEVVRWLRESDAEFSSMHDVAGSQ